MTILIVSTVYTFLRESCLCNWLRLNLINDREAATNTHTLATSDYMLVTWMEQKNKMAVSRRREGGGRLSLKIPCLPQSDRQHKNTIYRKLYGTFWYKFSLHSWKKSQTPFPVSVARLVSTSNRCHRSSWNGPTVPGKQEEHVTHCAQCYIYPFLAAAGPVSEELWCKLMTESTCFVTQNRSIHLCSKTWEEKKKSLINYPKLSA